MVSNEYPNRHMSKITVLLCDDHYVVRQGLRLLLEVAGDIRAVGEAENGHRSVEETKPLRPDVILLDTAMPELNGLEATRQITMAVSSAKVLILSGYGDEHFVQQAIEAGAAGYVMKEAAGLMYARPSAKSTTDTPFSARLFSGTY
jgi:DNA-binding NarL/FixJ family response regulator